MLPFQIFLKSLKFCCGKLRECLPQANYPLGSTYEAGRKEVHLVAARQLPLYDDISEV